MYAVIRVHANWLRKKVSRSGWNLIRQNKVVQIFVGGEYWNACKKDCGWYIITRSVIIPDNLDKF